MKSVSTWFLYLYRSWSRLSAKCFSLLISHAFAGFGSNTVIVNPLRLSGEERISIGDRIFIGAGSWLQTLPDGPNRSVAIRIGSGTSIAGACVISAVRSVRLEEEVLLARNVYISDHIHRYTEIGTPILRQGVDKVQPVVIRRGAWLGQNVVVCPGVTIGQGSVIGAASVVTHDIPDYVVAAGVPARVIKQIETKPVRLSTDLIPL
jgi:acetyltransferase-like isoleucine patch superfamily enzyme